MPRWQRVAVFLAVAIVVVVAAVSSYHHMQTVARYAGESWLAYLLPLSVDGQVTSASLAAWRSKEHGEPVHVLTKLSLVVGLLVSVAANVLVPFLGALSPTAHAYLAASVAAWPALALALSFEQLLRLRTVPTGAEDEADTTLSPITTEEATARGIAALRTNPDIKLDQLAAISHRSTRWASNLRRKVLGEQPVSYL